MEKINLMKQMQVKIYTVRVRLNQPELVNQ